MSEVKDLARCCLRDDTPGLERRLRVGRKGSSEQGRDGIRIRAEELKGEERRCQRKLGQVAQSRRDEAPSEDFRRNWNTATSCDEEGKRTWLKAGKAIVSLGPFPPKLTPDLGV